MPVIQNGLIEGNKKRFSTNIMKRDVFQSLLFNLISLYLSIRYFLNLFSDGVLNNWALWYQSIGFNKGTQR